MNDPQLQNLLDDLDATQGECDATSRLVVTRLAQKRIPYRVMMGQVELDGKVASPHFWVEAQDCVIDYRARQRLGSDQRVPHGVVRRNAMRYTLSTRGSRSLSRSEEHTSELQSRE